MFPQPHVTPFVGGRTRLDDFIGVRFALLSWGTDPQVHLSPEFRQYWHDLGAALFAIVPMEQLANFRGTLLPGTSLVGDTSGMLHDWFADQGADGSIVVLRPDRFVAGICPPQDLEAASAELRALLGGRLAASLPFQTDGSEWPPPAEPAAPLALKTLCRSPSNPGFTGEVDVGSRLEAGVAKTEGERDG
jgi:3-(3-hydroxy-phenyl)propionate hydroxylase